MTTRGEGEAMESHATPAGPRPPWTADRLDVRLAQRRVDARQIAGLAQALAALHESLAEGACADAAALATRGAAHGAAIRALEPALADAAAACETALAGALRGAQPVLAERAACGSGMRRLHRDLRCECIYVDPVGRTVLGAPAPPSGAGGDPCQDLAALAVALVARGRADLARQLVAGYAEATGDFGLYRVLDAYVALAALAAAHAASAAAPGAEAARAAAERLLAAPAVLASREAPLRVIAVGGAMATGKSTLAAKLAAAHAAPLVSADAARAAVAARVRGAAALAAFDDEETYAETLRRAAEVLASGRPVVIDACFPTRALREALCAWAKRHGAPLLFVECRADARLTRRRLQERARLQGRAESDWLTLRDRLLAAWEPVKELPRSQHLVVDTARDPEECLDRIARALGRGVSAPHRVRRAELPRGARSFAS
jgi:predicted kinase